MRGRSAPTGAKAVSRCIAVLFFFLASTVSTPCAISATPPASHILTHSAPNVQAMDGQRGSLCTDTPRWKGAKVVGCIAMLACEPLIGPLVSTGYGYCTDLGVGPFGMTAMMRRATISQRSSGGKPCRLPLVVECAPTQPHADVIGGYSGWSQKKVLTAAVLMGARLFRHDSHDLPPSAQRSPGGKPCQLPLTIGRTLTDSDLKHPENILNTCAALWRGGIGC